MNFERRFHPGVQKSSGITLSDLDKGGPERPEIAEAAMPHELFLKGAKEALDASVSLRLAHESWGRGSHRSGTRCQGHAATAPHCSLTAWRMGSRAWRRLASFTPWMPMHSAGQGWMAANPVPAPSASVNVAVHRCPHRIGRRGHDRPLRPAPGRGLRRPCGSKLLRFPQPAQNAILGGARILVAQPSPEWIARYVRFSPRLRASGIGFSVTSLTVAGVVFPCSVSVSRSRRH